MSKDKSDKAGNDKPAKQPYGGFKLFGAYLISWLVILIVFKKLYDLYLSRKRYAFKWFGGHPERDAYEEALGSTEENSEGEEKLRKLLLRRAMTDVRRLLQISNEKESLYNLMRSGALAEDMWADFKDAENEMQLEVFDLQAEAETFKQGTIFSKQ